MAEYRWSEEFAWWGVAFYRIPLYLMAIQDRKQAEWGDENDSPINPKIFELLDIVEQVKKEHAKG